MNIYKHKAFQQWAESEGVTDRLLKKAVDEMTHGLFEAHLGSGLYKKRVAASGRGKSGGYRTLVAFKMESRAFFVYGFAKNVRASINAKEEKIYRQLAKEFLSMNEIEIAHMLAHGKLFEVK